MGQNNYATAFQAPRFVCNENGCTEKPDMRSVGPGHFDSRCEECGCTMSLDHLPWPWWSLFHHNEDESVGPFGPYSTEEAALVSAYPAMARKTAKHGA